MMDKIKGLWTRYVPRISRRANTSLKVVYLYGAGLLILFSWFSFRGFMIFIEQEQLIRHS